MAKKDLFNYDLEGMRGFFSELGEKPFRAGQLMSWVYRKHVTDFDRMHDLSKGLRAKLAEAGEFPLPEVVDERLSSDGTRKFLLRLSDGELVETVLIPDGDRMTQCVSTQAGCAMGCKFCRTAAGGLSRNLTVGEIVVQVFFAQKLLGEDTRITNIVFMGMGEPLHNLENSVGAFRLLSSDHGPKIAKRRITISTCGLVDAMKKLPTELLPSLAISLNATTDEVRDRIMPVNRKYPIADLLKTLKGLELPSRARYTIEYVMIGGVNDTLEDAKRLVNLLSDVRCKVNLIPFNDHDDGPFQAPTAEAVERFQTYLLDRHFTAVLRKSRGDDILAGCGQLRGEKLDGTHEAGN